MPLFEYRCNKCEHVTSFLENSKNQSKHPCEKCGSDDTSKMLSTFAAQNKSQRQPSCSDGSCSTGSCPFS
jgi:putative FmdB family regulatory protein